MKSGAMKRKKSNIATPYVLVLIGVLCGIAVYSLGSFWIKQWKELSESIPPSQKDESMVSPTIIPETTSVETQALLCTEEEFVRSLQDNSRELSSVLASAADLTQVAISLEDGRRCNANVKELLNVVAGTDNSELKDGFADYVYVKGDQFMVSRPTELWIILLQSRKTKKIWEIPDAQHNSLWITKVENFRFSNETILVFQVQPSGLGGVNDDSQRILEHDCALPSAGMWSYDTISGKVQRIQGLEHTELCR